MTTRMALSVWPRGFVLISGLEEEMVHRINSIFAGVGGPNFKTNRKSMLSESARKVFFLVADGGEYASIWHAVICSEIKIAAASGPAGYRTWLSGPLTPSRGCLCRHYVTVHLIKVCGRGRLGQEKRRPGPVRLDAYNWNFRKRFGRTPPGRWLHRRLIYEQKRYIGLTGVTHNAV